MSEGAKETMSSFGQLRAKVRGMGENPDSISKSIVEKMFKVVRAYSPDSIYPGVPGVPAVNSDPKIQIIRDAIDGEDYATAIDQAQQCYQDYYLPTHPDAPLKIDDYVLNVVKRETSEQAT